MLMYVILVEVVLDKIDDHVSSVQTMFFLFSVNNWFARLWICERRGFCI